MTYDCGHNYAWDVNGNLHSVDTTSLTYDALGRMVEKNVSGTYTQIVYGPVIGKFAIMSGQTLVKALVQLPQGATAVYDSSGLAYIRHSDHLGSSRLATTPARTMYSSTAYAPYGEPYAQAGTPDLSFTGQDPDTLPTAMNGTTPGMYDFLLRGYNPVQGRWLSPDPAGMGAVDPNNPQTWNRYGYVGNNPLSFIDPFGTCEVVTVVVGDQVSTVYRPDSGLPCPMQAIGQPPPGCTLVPLYGGGFGAVECSGTVPTETVDLGNLAESTGTGEGNGAHSCVGARIVKGIQGVTNVTLGELKTAGAVDVGILGAAGAPETGGLSLGATLAAGYLIISSQGQVTSGFGQLYSAISGDFAGGEGIQQVGDIMSGPVTGITTLVATGGNVEKAATYAGFESALTLGAGAVNSEAFADKLANGVDAVLSLVGVVDVNCK